MDLLPTIRKLNLFQMQENRELILASRFLLSSSLIQNDFGPDHPAGTEKPALSANKSVFR